MTILAWRTGSRPRAQYLGMLSFYGESANVGTPKTPYYVHIHEARSMFKNTAGQSVYVFAFDATTNLPKTGDAANITAYIAKDFGAVTQLTDTGASEVDPTNAKGLYVFTITQAETNADVVAVTARSATGNVVVIGEPPIIFTQAPNLTKLSVDTNGRVDVAKVAGTTQTADDLGVLPARLTAARAGYLDNLSAGPVALAATQGQTMTPAVFQMLYNTAGEFYVTLTKLAGGFANAGDYAYASGDVKVSKDGGGAANIATPPVAIAMGNVSIWKFQLSAAELQAKRTTITVGDAASGKAVQDCVFDILTYGHPSSGLPWLGAVVTGAAVSASINKVRISETGIDPTALSLIVTSTTGGSGGTPTLESRIGNDFDAVNKDVGIVPDFAEVPAGLIFWAGYAFGGRVVTDYATTDNQTLLSGKIDAVDNKLPSVLVGGRMDASVGAVASNAITGTGIDSTAVVKIQAGLPTAVQNADALLDRVDGIEPGYTFRKAMRLNLSVSAAICSGLEGNNPIFMDINNTKPRVQAVTDQFGNRSAVTYDTD